MATISERLPLSGDDELVLQVLDHMIWPILVVAIVAIGVVVPGTFHNLQSIVFILHGSVALGFVTLAAGICLIAGYFDLSVGAMAGFAAMFAGLVIGNSGWALVQNPYVGFALIGVVGLLVGGFNGYMISKVGINPFLQTLSMLIVLEGGTVTLSSVTVTGLPGTYLLVGDNSAIAIGSLIGSYFVAGYVLRNTQVGQAVYALGSDEGSARAVGVDTDRLTILVYAVSGVLAAIGGLMLTGFIGAVSPRLADGMLFPAFAAAVIGGISLFGGRGRITGALGGVLLLGLIQSALNISGVQPEAIELTNGLVLLVAVILYNSRTRIRKEILAKQV